MDTYFVRQFPIRVETFRPSSPGPHPALMLLHGADGLPGRGLPYRDLAARFAGHGYVVFLPHYFDATQSHGRPNPLNPLFFAAWMTAVGEGIAHALRQPDVAGPTVALAGFSLGGYLSVAVASQDDRVGAVVECCGGAADIFLREARTMPPVLILHGGADPVVPVSEAHRLEEFLRARQSPFDIHIYPGRGHQLGGADLDDAVRRALDFLGRHLGVEAA